LSLKDIKEGWLNYIKSLISKKTLDPEFSKVVSKRASICTTCPYLVMTRLTKDAVYGKCKKCGCIYPAMIFAAGKKCPIGKWSNYES